MGFVQLLFIISGIICFGLSQKRNMWGWIVAYWLVLTAKNLMDLVGVS